MAFEVLCRTGFLPSGIFKEHGPVSGPQVNRWHLDSGPGEAEEVTFAATERHRRKACCGPVMFRQFLVEADISFRIVVGQNRANSAEQDRDALMAPSETVVEI